MDTSSTLAGIMPAHPPIHFLHSALMNLFRHVISAPTKQN
jgi:hypothetical protein